VANLRDKSTEIRPGDGPGGLCLLAIARGVVSRHPLPDSGDVMIGRTEQCGIRIDDASVSRQHAVLHVGPKLTVEDLGSANGTFVRTSGVADPKGKKRLSPGERIEVGLGDFLEVGSLLFVVWRDAGGAELPGGAAETLPPDIVVRDPAMQSLHALLGRIAAGDISVLLLGETGVGKEVFAESLHRLSPRGRRPFLRLNCAALTETLLESELFGFEKGAFTGAANPKPGLLEAARGGTVFLDEVGDLPAPIQAKLLRVIEDRKVLRLGGLTPRTIDVRFVAATNRDLDADIEKGTFRRDLFFRLNGISLVIPPLRERVGEIAELARTFAKQSGERQGRKAPPITADAIAALERYRWPGNIRELRNMIDRAVLLCDGEIRLEHLAFPSPRGASIPQSAQPMPAVDVGGESGSKLRNEVDAFERQRIVEALEKCAGNQTRAAKLLGISRRTLTNRLNQYVIPRPLKR
jgi:two-component system response regulator AtoC